ncbi:hypothetical protein LQ938_02165 [Microbacterium sp. cx-55]|uniref:hypothetical protein n=1 Tax=Microbacterium sp. cx-55 TaxID=2875948 RepID=UPI001CBEEB4D|nr:hypothetical protein [Microbacterium sp. cx-55]MBZ4487611.1 hypothetical protein [Microbacterium sp. cx-55]UGB35625.1 hypothetical protein LQ938_02165 [Microbacterium sp. cx-55]
MAWPLALVLTGVGFLALVIAGLGIGSLNADADVIAVPGLGPLPGPLAVVGSGVAYALVAWQAVRLARPRFTAVIGVTIASYLAYGIVGGVAALFATGSLGATTTVAIELLLRWPGLVVAASAAIASWCAIALVRTRATQPRWPWERDDEE